MQAEQSCQKSITVKLWNSQNEKQLDIRNNEKFKKAEGEEQDEYKVLEQKSKNLSVNPDKFLGKSKQEHLSS